MANANNSGEQTSVDFKEKLQIKLESNQTLIKLKVYGVNEDKEELLESFDLVLNDYLAKLFD